MSIAENRRPQAGYTFLEMCAVLVISSLGALLMQWALTATQRADQMLGALRRATERGAALAFEVRDLVTSSRRIFDGSGVGPGYLAVLDLAAAPLAPGSRLPTVDEAGRLEPDATGDPHAGNVLLVARESDPVACVVDPATGRRRHIDTYRFGCVYPSVSTRRLVKGGTPAWDLVLWRSSAFPSLPQLLAISDVTERERAVADLVNHFGLSVAWDPEQAAPDAFYALSSDGTIASQPLGDPIVSEDPGASSGRRLVAASLQLARTDPDVASRVSLFSVEPIVDWSPHGFETKVVGPSGARKVGLRLVVEAPVGGGPLTVTVPTTVLASARNL